MSTLSATSPTLLDVSQRLDPNGQIAAIAEILNGVNECLQDAVMVEGNLPTGHRTTIRTGIPAPTWRKLYGGVQPSKSTAVQVTESCGMLENYSRIDKALADLNGNTAAFRLSEDKAIIEGISQEMASKLFYGNEAITPEAFTGLSPRYNDRNVGGNASNILSSAANPDNTDNASIWLVGWGPDTVHLIYPKGSKAGLSFEDKGVMTIQNSDGSYYEAYLSHYRWDVGLCVRDWRYAVRINIDQEDLVADYATGPKLIDLMVQAEELIPNLSGCKPAFYMNRSLRSMLRRQKIKAAAYNLTDETVGGKHVTMFDGIPVRRVDALLNTESGVLN